MQVLILPLSTGGIFIEGGSLPVDLVVIRASSVPKYVNGASELSAGITGSDILQENGIKPKDFEELPIESNSNLFLGVTMRLIEQLGIEGSEMSPDILRGQTVVTKFPRLTREVFRANGVKTRGWIRANKATLLVEPGKTEAIQYVDPKCNGIFDVTSSEKTAKANSIKFIQKYPVSVGLVRSRKLTARQAGIIADFTQALR